MPRPLKVLIVEDNPADAEMTLLELRSAGFEPDWQRVDTEAGYLERLDGSLDLVLSDFQMPLFGGLRALELMRQSGLDVPFILLSGTIGEETAAAAIKNGAADYLMKDRLAPLGSAVTHALAERRLLRERRQADEAAQRQLSELRVLFDMMPAMIWFKDTENRILRVNQRVAETVGKPVAEIEGKTSSEIYPMEAARFLEDDLKVIRSGVPRLGIIETVRDREGRELWVQTDKVPVLDKDRKVIGIVVMAQDITERKRAEEALRQSEERFSGAFEHAPIGVALLSVDGRWLQVNRALCDLVGYSEAELLAMDFQDITHPDDLAASRENVRRIAAGEIRSYEMEKRYIHRCGKILTILLNVSLVRDRQDKPQYLIAQIQDITSRRAAEIALGEMSQKTARRERLLNSALSSMSDFAQIYDREGRLLFANQPLLDLWGLTMEEVVGRNFFDLKFPDELAGRLQRQLRHVFETGKAVTDESAYTNPSGLEGYYENIFAPVFAADGTVDLVVGSTRDVTARKRSEESLRAFAANLAASQGIAHLGSWELDLARTDDINANALRWSDEMFRIAGFEPGTVEVSNELFFRLVPREDHEPIRQAMAAAIRERRIYSIVHRLVRADGDVRVLQETAQVFLDDKTGRPLKIMGTAHDITLSRKAEEALRLSEKRFKALFEQAAVGVAQADAVTGRFVQVNQRFCEITGRSREELEQVTFASITHPQDVPRDMETMRQIREGSIREATREKRYMRKDGSTVWVNLTISAMWAPGEPPDYMIAVAQDVTERKLLEEQFRQAQKMEAIGTLAGGIAHDFNNILAAINGYTELSRMSLKGNPEVREYLGSVLQASTRATDLIRQILAFSRQQPSERRPIKLRPVIEETLKLLRATIPSTIEFETSFARDVPTVLADATQIHQILMNLGTNASHAMKDRPGRLQVKLERCAVDAMGGSAQPWLRPGVYARISVGDTGCGMDAATARRIFDPFFTTKPLGEGTGLGLAVVHGIMDSHDGVVTVHSQPGEGAVFHLYFPAHAGEAIVTPGGEESTPFGHGERILFVDDEELLARLGQKTLVALGYEVEVAMQPAAALAMVRSDPKHFALVITDQTMPGMTGLVLASRLRQIRADLPIIMTTGHSLSLTAERVEAAGISQLLLKPTTLHSLGAAVHAALTPRH